MTRRSGEEIEYIDQSLQKIIFARINKLIEGNSGIKTVTKNAYDEYLIKYRRLERTLPIVPRSITYDMLPDALSVARMSIADLYKAAGIEVQWPSKDARRIASACTALKPDVFQSVYSLALELSPKFWQNDPAFITACPSIRVMRIFKHKFTLKERHMIIDSVGKDRAEYWKRDLLRNGGFSSIRTIDLPSIANSMGISLHWLMKQDFPTPTVNGNITDSAESSDAVTFAKSVVLAKNYDIEMILTAFMFMPPRIQSAFKSAVVVLSKK